MNITINLTNDIKNINKHKNISCVLLGDNQIKNIPLELMPYDKFNDLYILYQIKNDNHSVDFITDKWLKEEGINKEELQRIAEYNMNNKDFQINSLNNFIMSEIFGFEDIIYYDKNTIYNLEREEGIYILTNENKTLSSSLILSKTIMETISEHFNSDLIILPSSIHETLILPLNSLEQTDDKNNNIKTCREIVEKVNSTQVKPEEQLSNNIYLYSREKKNISIIH